jgi:prepilin-type N-terminal cleavage/methylation domain-containing protein
VKLKRKNKGFTLIEVFIVLIIISMLVITVVKCGRYQSHKKPEVIRVQPKTKNLQSPQKLETGDMKKL